MVDFHTHILPQMDDGSASVAMSVTMLEWAQKQGVTTVVVTPHFYGDRESPQAFLARRSDRWDCLQQAWNQDTMPQLYLGAEVAYYQGLRGSAYLQDLCIQGTKLLLIELPLEPCTEGCYREIQAIYSQGYQPVMAHVERYFHLQKPAPFLRRLRESGALIQCNSACFLNGIASSRAFGMMKKGEIDFLGSDCHNLTTRPPNLEQAMAVLRRKIAAPELAAVIDRGQAWFAQTTVE